MFQRQKKNVHPEPRLTVSQCAARRCNRARLRIFGLDMNWVFSPISIMVGDVPPVAVKVSVLSSCGWVSDAEAS